VHVANETGKTKDVTAPGHPRGYRSPEADGTGCLLGLFGCQYLQDIIPVEMDIGIDALRAIVAVRIDDEAIVGMHVSR
jgi:hypothetical protein